MSFTIYQASAGSGKTFSLAKEYLKITLQNPDAYKNILAITFTNKAAAEMKERILSYLKDLDSGDLSSDGYTQMLPIILNEVKIDQELAVQNASILLKKIIYNYADFSVMTIDAFFQRILRTFAFDLDIPMNFQLEIDSKELIDQVVELLIEQVGENESLTAMMIDFIDSSSEESKSWHIEKDIISFTPELLSEHSKNYIESLKDLSLADFTLIINDFVQEKRILKQKMIKSLAALRESLANQQIPETEFKNDFLSRWFKSIENESYDVKIGLKKALADKSWFAKTKEKFYLSAFNAMEVEFSTLLQQTIDDSRRILFISAIQRKIFPMALLNELKRTVSHIESLEHTFQISNTNFKINEITSQEPAPFIYERLGDKYYYYFIDEFQDTSRLQWLNVLPLICEALSGYHGTEQGKAILFGDPKQAIYRFRGGDLDQFVALPNIINDEQNPLIDLMSETIKNQYVPIPLETNYRSLSNVIEFNNQFFQYLSDGHDCLKPYYKNHRQFFLKSKIGGLVTVSIYRKGAEVKYPDFALEQIGIRVSEALRDGFMLKDIAILTRDKKHAPEIASFLSSKGFQVISSDSLLIKSSLKVLFILEILRYYLQSENQVMAFSVFAKYRQLFGGDVGMIDSKNMSVKYLESVFANDGCMFKFETLASFDLYERTEYITRSFGFNASGDAYLLALLSVMSDKSLAQIQEHKFWEWWDENSHKLSVEIPENMNGITLLTIHKAKGLEYPVVIVPDYEPNNKKGDLWVKLSEKSSDLNKRLSVAKLPVKEEDESEFSSEISEELNRILIDKVNVLYVALTRAVERLHIILQAPTPTSNSFSYKNSFYNFISSTFPNSQEEFDSFSFFAYGDYDPKRGTSKPTIINKIEVNQLYSSDWKENDWLSNNPEKSQAQQFGILLHNTMSYINSVDDVNLALDISQRVSNLDDEIVITLKKQINSIVNHPELIRFFQPGSTVYNEIDVVDADAKVHRPDRVVCIQDEVAVIDFKTGIINEHYHNQINAYKDLYLQLGYKNINGYIVYANPDSVEVVIV
ncbi:MAG: UvrD-helicase domain-containing protein [Bacteroidota bacterium]